MASLSKFQLHIIPSIIPPAFGLDISDSSIKYVQLNKANNSYKVNVFGEIKIPAGVIERGVIKDVKGLSNILKKELLGQKSKKLTPYVVISMPDENVFLKKLTLPLMKEENLWSAVRVEAEPNMPIAIEKAYLDYKVLPSKKGAKNLEVLAVVVDKSISDAYSDAVAGAGLFPVIIEPEVAAISRVAIKSFYSAEPVIVIEIGENRTRLIVFVGKNVVLTNSINFSAGMVNKIIADSLKINSKDAYKIKWSKALSKKSNEGRSITDALKEPLDVLAQEIDNHIDSLSKSGQGEDVQISSPINKIIISGGGSKIPGIDEFLKAKLNIPVEIIDSSVNIKDLHSSIKPEQVSSFTTALGLALRGAQLDYNI